MADVTGNKDVGQEVHLDLQRSVPVAVLAPPTRDIEAEASTLVAPRLALGKLCEQAADRVEDSDIGCRVGARGTPDWRLVDIDHLVDEAGTGQLGVPFEGVRLLGKPALDCREQHLVEQCALAAAGDAGKDHQLAKRDVDVDPFQVVHPRPFEFQMVAVSPSPLLGNVDGQRMGEELAGDRLGIPFDFGRGALGGDIAAFDSRSRSQVDHIVGLADRILVMLDHQDGVAQVPKVLQRVDQLLVVPLVEPD